MLINFSYDDLPKLENAELLDKFKVSNINIREKYTCLLAKK